MGSSRGSSGPAASWSPQRTAQGTFQSSSIASVTRHDFTTRAHFADRETVERYVSSMSRDAHGEPTVFLARP